MITFDKEYYVKFQDYTVNGTGYLAYRDIEKIVNLYHINLEKVLDLGSASGRSTKFLTTLAKEIYACDISSDAINLVHNNVTKNAFVSNIQRTTYEHYPYSSIFSFFTFLHLTTQEEIVSEFNRCKSSLIENGYLVIVTGHKNLFYKNYASVSCTGKKPTDDGQITKIKLKKIDCEFDNCFWEYLTLIKLATQSNFDLAGLHFPVGKKIDGKEYIDEYKSPPYVYIILRRR